MRVYNWSNDVLFREQSFNSEPIILENHRAWYLGKIRDKNTLFLVGLVNGKPAGLVRFDINEEHSTVGVLIDQKYRGQKLASIFLKKASKIYFSSHDVPIFAYIKYNNIASIKSFENA
ncbi:GNAT family N-acetyltransferase [Winogradskyella sp. UBA3174]|uniref:GNAT family N-acetyltransferase n=1 Tax=Winogradskyella sp. UBA3174 TaxID=1947785 RepID=UPI0025E593FC|nr:GNAT family N-acetyltransferase [Winogradskyella sp. UBA3174]|tara:strand:+ start:63722 stop:64075 length:354 start_codon:yes stop_codon:yes gene_type:complete